MIALSLWTSIQEGSDYMLIPPAKSLSLLELGDEHLYLFIFHVNCVSPYNNSYIFVLI